MRSMQRVALAAAAAAALWSGCAPNDAAPPPAADTPPPVQVGAENIVTVENATLVNGPLLSGEIRAAREATVRAELGGSMLEVNVEEGQTVRRGAIIGRIEAATLEDARRSAESAVRAAQNQLDVARREAARTEQLVKAGALATRDLELAQSNVAAVEAQLADAESRLVSARKQQGDAVVRAPINGVVAERAVGRGDVVTPGTALFTIIDPSSMRLEASVASDQVGLLAVGLPVRFTVRGYSQAFEGRIERMSPVADATTRQVPIFVTIPDPEGRLVAGLYAEGRVVLESATGAVVAENAVNTSEAQPWVLRVTEGRTERVPVTIGLRDPQTERVQLSSGVSPGDVLLRGSAQGIPPQTAVALATVAR